MLMMSGLDDPVGEYGKGVYRAYDSYHGHLEDIDLRLFEDCRHELCNELNKEEIYSEIYECFVFRQTGDSKCIWTSVTA